MKSIAKEISLRILLVTDAWEPQVNGVVRTLKTTARELTAMGHEVRFLTPLEFRTLPCPSYPEIRLSLFPQRGVTQRIREFDPDVLHIATEGPLGMAARRFALRNDFPFTTAYHTRFPEYVHARMRLPLKWSYAWLRHFHSQSRAVMAPTQVVVDDLVANGFERVRLWSRGVDTDIFHPQPSKRLNSEPPIFLYVGRVAVEKNVEAFLELDLPGSKWVVGTGPALESIRAKYPKANYLGLLDREELAKVYAAADVFVFPSKTDTFGLVLLEAMACGLPVAAYPVTGPRDVIGDSRAGALRDDLRTACLDALNLKREDAIARAGLFTWRAATEQFFGHLHPRKRILSVPAYA
jgi:glycosyltransferase involved in cell wall biosynthesis